MGKSSSQSKAAVNSAATPREDEPEIAELALDSPVESLDSELQDAATTSAAYEIVTIPADFTLEGLLTKWK